MSKQSQKDAVYNAVVSVLAENNISLNETTNVNNLMNRTLRSQVNQILFEGFRSGSIVMDKDLSDVELKNYVSGLQSNWLRKDKRLNGNTPYSAKNPGTRVGSTDPQVKAMRALLSTLSSTEDKLEVQSAIDARLTELNNLKRQALVSSEALPETIRNKFIK